MLGAAITDANGNYVDDHLNQGQQCCLRLSAAISCMNIPPHPQYTPQLYPRELNNDPFQPLPAEAGDVARI